MTFATPLGLLALLSIPAIVAIHLFRRRFPERRIAGLFLWQAGREVAQGGGRIDRLPITWSLLLECLAALALSLILAGARLSSAAALPHLVVLLDDSASMSALVGDGVTARDRAVERVGAEMAALGRGGRVTLVRSGDRPVVLAGPSALAAEAEAALDAWQPGARHHELALALRLSRELAGPSGRLLIVSDTTAERRHDGEIAHARWVAVGAPQPNVGIIAATRTIAPAQGAGALVLTLGNYGDTPQRRRLRVRAGDTDVTIVDVTAAPGTSVVRVALPAGLPVVRATLSDDALPADNDVWLAEPHSRLVTVHNQLTQARGRDAMTRALAALSNVAAAPSGVLQIVDAAALTSPPPPGAWRLAFGSPPAALRSSGSAEDFIGPYVIEKRHPLLAGVGLGGVVWTGALPLAPGIRPLVSAGDRPLVADITPSGGATTILFNLDLERTNLIRTPDWPVVVSNVIEMRRQGLPGPERWNYRSGEWVRVRLATEPTAPLQLRTGTDARVLPPSRQIEFVAPERVGPLEIREGEKTLFTLGVNFLDETESDLRTRAAAESGAFADDPSALRTERDVTGDPLFWILLVVAGAAILANWCLPRMERRLA